MSVYNHTCACTIHKSKKKKNQPVNQLNIAGFISEIVNQIFDLTNRQKQSICRLEDKLGCHLQECHLPPLNQDLSLFWSPPIRKTIWWASYCRNPPSYFCFPNAGITSVPNSPGFCFCHCWFSQQEGTSIMGEMAQQSRAPIAPSTNVGQLTITCQL